MSTVTTPTLLVQTTTQKKILSSTRTLIQIVSLTLQYRTVCLPYIAQKQMFVRNIWPLIGWWNQKGQSWIRRLTGFLIYRSLITVIVLGKFSACTHVPSQVLLLFIWLLCLHFSVFGMPTQTGRANSLPVSASVVGRNHRDQDTTDSNPKLLWKTLCS